MDEAFWRNDTDGSEIGLHVRAGGPRPASGGTYEQQIKNKKLFASGFMEPIHLQCAALEKKGLGIEAKAETFGDGADFWQGTFLDEEIDDLGGSNNSMHGQRKPAAQRIRDLFGIKFLKKRLQLIKDVHDC